MTLQELQDKKLKEFDEKFTCIQDDCDGNGSIPFPVDDGVWKADQCQFHAEYLFCIEKFLSTAIQEAYEEGITKERERCSKIIEKYYPEIGIAIYKVWKEIVNSSKEEK